ncbi:MAG: hypothetical protein ABI635_03070 [Actinomycetota bacterium]
MTNLLTMRSPRWLGWVLLISGALLATLMTFLIVVFAVVGDGWQGGDVYLAMFWLCGAEGVVAGVRILGGTSTRGT